MSLSGAWRGKKREGITTAPLSPIYRICQVDIQHFKKRLEKQRLPGGVFYIVTGVPDAYTANRCMEIVRDYHV